MRTTCDVSSQLIRALTNFKVLADSYLVSPRLKIYLPLHIFLRKCFECYDDDGDEG